MLRDIKWAQPTPAQAEAGNYYKPTVPWRGLTIKVENPAGTIRRGNGWQTKMVYDYGYVSSSEAVDGDEVDVYLGPSLTFAPMVYVVHQRRYGDWEKYDEDKCMLGFLSEDAAKHAYLQHYDDPRFLGPITAMPVEEFVSKVRSTKDKPAMIKALLLKTHVSGYTRKDGTVVPPHEDSRAQSLHDDIERQEKWLQVQARELGYRDIEHLLESDYPAFERLAAQWREQNPVEVALKSIIFFKGFVGPYLRGGRVVNVSGYHGRTGHAHAVPGQMSLFGGPTSGMPLPPSPLQGKDAVAHTPDMFADADEHGEVPPGRRIMREPQHTEPTRELIAEHEHLVDVLNSPSHADDKAEAKKQGAELAEMKQEAGEHDHLLADLPAGAKFTRGKGRIAGHYAVEADGITGNYHEKPDDAVASVKQFLSSRDAGAKQKADRAAAISGMRARLTAGGDVTDADLKLLELKDGSAGLKWFIPAAAEVFGITSHAVRPHIKDLIRTGHTDMGTKLEFVNPREGLQAIAAGLSPATVEDHPAPMPRSLLAMIPEDKRDEWKDLHRQQHELHHYELGQVREKLDRLRSKRNKAQAAMNEAEAGVRSLRGAPVPDPVREDAAQKSADKHRADFDKLAREQDGLVGQHQSLYEKITKLGRAKERISAGSGDLDIDWAAMRKRTAEEQQAHEKSMLKMYREHYKAAPMTKAIVFLRPPAS